MKRYFGIDFAAINSDRTIDLSEYHERGAASIPNRKIILKTSAEFIKALRKNHHGKDCIICFEQECVCKPKQ